MSERISIALCTYNGAKYLPEQLDSFLRQSRRPDEVVACDDCSSDETIAILEDFKQRAPFSFVIYRNHPNLGVIKNFEKAISLCTGDLIFLSDQDDVWRDDKIERTSAEFEQKPDVLMAFSDAELVDEDLASLNSSLWQFYFSFRRQIRPQTSDFFEAVLESNVVTGATMAFRASLRERFMPIPTEIPLTIHDGWISLVAAALGEVSFIEEKLIKYRQHAGQQIGVTARKLENRDDFAKSIKDHETNLRRLALLRDLLLTNEVFWGRRASIAKLDVFVEKVQATITHYKMRGGLRENRFNRASDIFRELLTGRYHRFSKGFLSAAKDLLG